MPLTIVRRCGSVKRLPESAAKIASVLHDASSTARAEAVAKAVVALRITHGYTVKKHATLQNHAYGRFARHAVDKSSHEPFKC